MYYKGKVLGAYPTNVENKFSKALVHRDTEGRWLHVLICVYAYCSYMYTVYSLIHSPLILDLALIQCIYTLSFIYSPKPSAGPLTSHLSSATSPLIHLKHPMHAHGTPHSPKHPIHAHFSHSSILGGFLSSLSSLPSFLLSCHLCRSARIF